MVILSHMHRNDIFRDVACWDTGVESEMIPSNPVVKAINLFTDAVTRVQLRCYGSGAQIIDIVRQSEFVRIIGVVVCCCTVTRLWQLQPPCLFVQRRSAEYDSPGSCLFTRRRQCAKIDNPAKAKIAAQSVSWLRENQTLWLGCAAAGNLLFGNRIYGQQGIESRVYLLALSPVLPRPDDQQHTTVA